MSNGDFDGQILAEKLSKLNNSQQSIECILQRNAHTYIWFMVIKKYNGWWYFGCCVPFGYRFTIYMEFICGSKIIWEIVTCFFVAELATSITVFSHVSSILYFTSQNYLSPWYFGCHIRIASMVPLIAVFLYSMLHLQLSIIFYSISLASFVLVHWRLLWVEITSRPLNSLFFDVG